ncbi:hypothetical protein EDD17DRAFT_1874919 [Pisolithus thermaeus]|nr:hypothetical protein EDD17DRAFT_1874919 [Pisolithus thermaeus]
MLEMETLTDMIKYPLVPVEFHLLQMTTLSTTQHPSNRPSLPHLQERFQGVKVVRKSHRSLERPPAGMWRRDGRRTDDDEQQTAAANQFVAFRDDRPVSEDPCARPLFSIIHFSAAASHESDVATRADTARGALLTSLHPAATVDPFEAFRERWPVARTKILMFDKFVLDAKLDLSDVTDIQAIENTAKPTLFAATIVSLEQLVASLSPRTRHDQDQDYQSILPTSDT